MNTCHYVVLLNLHDIVTSVHPLPDADSDLSFFMHFVSYVTPAFVFLVEVRVKPQLHEDILHLTCMHFMMERSP